MVALLVVLSLHPTTFMFTRNVVTNTSPRDIDWRCVNSVFQRVIGSKRQLGNVHNRILLTFSRFVETCAITYPDDFQKVRFCNVFSKCSDQIVFDRALYNLGEEWGGIVVEALRTYHFVPVMLQQWALQLQLHPPWQRFRHTLPHTRHLMLTLYAHNGRTTHTTATQHQLVCPHDSSARTR